ncbi:MAG: alpha/beta fold hydrolase [Mycobacteriaceae bacterium]
MSIVPHVITATTKKISANNFIFDVLAWGDLAGTPIVLLHGFPSLPLSFEPLAQILAQKGYGVIAPAQRGYSEGARPSDPSEYTTEALAGDVAALLDAMGIVSAHIVGHDWGAMVAWVFAATYSERACSLTAVSVPHPAAYGWALAHDADQQQRSSYIQLFRIEGKAEDVLLADDARRLRALYDNKVMDSVVDEQLRILSDRDTLTAALSWYRGVTSQMYKTPVVTIPTTYVWSTEDPALGQAGAYRCAEFVDAPYKLVVLEGISHWVPDEVPEELAKIIIDRVAGDFPRANSRQDRC